MTALHRKLLRDLAGIRVQAAAICLVMACGVATFVMSLSTLRSLKRTQETYYRRSDFADVFTHLKRAPQSLADRIAEIPGVSKVEPRIVERARLDMPGLSEPASGRLISIPESSPPRLNRLHLRAGRLIEPGRPGEVVVSAGFAEAHELETGDRIRAIVNGKRQVLEVVGIALSPEYIYQIREGEIMPDDKRFGVFWMASRELAAAFNMEGAFNDVSLTLTPDASEPEVLRRLDRLTAQHGGLEAYSRADQVSHKFLNNELHELQGMAVVVPSIFLGVASFLLNVVMTRLIGTQRTQIATLKAFGHTKREIGWHYLQLVLVFVVVGSSLGTGVGMWLGRGITQMYTRYFRFPELAFQLEATTLMWAVLVCGGAAVLGTLRAVQRAARLPPAQAMSPESPGTFRPTILDRLGLARFFRPTVRMIVRQMERRPWRVAASIMGVSLALAVVILGSFMLDALNYVIDSEFQIAQRQDLTVTFSEVTSGQAVYDVRHLPGVSACEPFRSVSARLEAGRRSRRVDLLGLVPQGRLFRLLDIDRNPVWLPPDGIVMSSKLAELLGVAPGDFLTVHTLEGSRPIREMLVMQVITDFQGTAAYMHIDALRRLMREGDAISGLHVAADTGDLDQLYSKLKGAPQVAGVTLKGAALRSFQKTIMENLLRLRFYNVAFAGIIAFGVVFNSARISLAERCRELATLRVIGFTTREISAMLLGELGIITVAAIPIGMAMGYGLGALLIELSYDTELFRIPLVIDRWTYGFAASVTLVATWISAMAVKRQLYDLDLVSVLKSKD